MVALISGALKLINVFSGSSKKGSKCRQDSDVAMVEDVLPPEETEWAYVNIEKTGSVREDLLKEALEKFAAEEIIGMTTWPSSALGKGNLRVGESDMIRHYASFKVPKEFETECRQALKTAFSNGQVSMNFEA